MGIKFFGQYLIEQGVVDSGQIRAALKLMDKENRSLGELAEAGGILTAEEAAKVNAQQRYCDLPFGELAVDMGLLSEEQVEYLIGFQEQTRLRLGEALVRLDCLPNERMHQLLVRHETEQALLRIGNVALPDGLESNMLAPTVLDLFPKLLVRIARIGPLTSALCAVVIRVFKHVRFILAVARYKTGKVFLHEYGQLRAVIEHLLAEHGDLFCCCPCKDHRLG